MPVPNALSLDTPLDHGLATAAQIRNDLNAIQSAFNTVLSYLTGAGDGNVLAYNTVAAAWQPQPGAKVTALTYSATIATDASLGTIFTIAVTNGTAFTISNPTNQAAGRTVTYDIKNSSGGVMGAITWGAAFLLAGAFTNPANGKRRTISFYYDGANWIELNRAAADI